MSGVRQKLVRLEDRDRRLLEELEVMRLINRDQAKLIGGFTSIRRTNVRLLSLVRAGILKQVPLARGEPNGYMRSGMPVPKKPGEPPTLFARHQLAVGAIYLLVKYGPVPGGLQLRRWVRFDQSLSKTIALVPDGYCELELAATINPNFLEIDLGTEALAVWQRKTQLYLQFAVSGEFSKIFGQPQFRVLVIANSDHRARTIQATVANTTAKIFWFSSFESIHHAGFWSPIWFRPMGGQPRSLF